jgi:sterol desaturase/sphingolipid hydroxylase (fatty acid hydroxylase superfamily)
MPVIWIFLFYTFMFYINMWGHTGYEFWHKDLLTHPVLRILNTPTHHNLHHKYHQANYSIYYNLWDSLCGTNHPEYENHYRAVKKKTELHKTSNLLKMMKL